MEFLVRIVDKLNPADAIGDKLLGKRGDVIAAVPDGHQWGREELTNPDWRILVVPGITRTEANGWLVPELPPDLSRRYVMLRKRGFFLDLTNIILLGDPPRHLIMLSDGTQVLAIDKIVVPLDVMRLRRQQKTRLAEPDEVR